MRTLGHLFERNRHWVEQQLADDPEHFSRWSESQDPGIFWIGCCDSRVPVTQMVDARSSEIFVHRNIANLAADGDASYEAALELAVEALHVRHVVVCGHVGCGGVRAALTGAGPPRVLAWVEPLRELLARHGERLDGLDEVTRWRACCELNVVEQTHELARHAVVRDAWERGDALDLHGWIYHPADGHLAEVQPCLARGEDPEAAYARALDAIIVRATS